MNLTQEKKEKVLNDNVKDDSELSDADLEDVSGGMMANTIEIDKSILDEEEGIEYTLTIDKLH